jgi:hypothetical protein
MQIMPYSFKWQTACVGICNIEARYEHRNNLRRDACKAGSRKTDTTLKRKVPEETTTSRTGNRHGRGLVMQKAKSTATHEMGRFVYFFPVWVPAKCYQARM